MSTTDRLYAVRGAVCCENTETSIGDMVPALYDQIVKRNGIRESDIVSILFTMTGDLTAMNPATALRKAGFAESLPLFASAEPYVEGYLPKVVRVLITYYGTASPAPVYLNGAESLRPDLAGSSGKAGTSGT